MGSKRKNLEDERIKRFSNIRTDSQFPYFKHYNVKKDPIQKHEKRKFNSNKGPCNIKVKKKSGGNKFREYSPPLTMKIMKECQERRKKEKEKYFVCKKEVIRLPSPLDLVVSPSNQEFQVPSVAQTPKISPEKKSLPDKWPREPRPEDLQQKVLKSGVFINDRGGTRSPVDSHYYIYDEKYRKKHPWYEMYRGSDTIEMQVFHPYLMDTSWSPESYIQVDDTFEEDEEDAGEDDYAEAEDMEVQVDFKHNLQEIDYSKKLEQHSPSASSGQSSPGEDGSGVDMTSAATSAGNLDLPQPDQLENEDLFPEVVDRILQTFQTSETNIHLEENVKRGTLTSHSASVVTKLPDKIFFGVKMGTMHYGDSSFSERSRYRQGLPMCVSAYIYSFIKPPNKWNTQDINQVLDLGDKLYLKCLDILHLHENPRILNPEDLYEMFEYKDRKICYKIDDPDIAGFTRSEDPKVYNLIKGLNLFFTRNRSGILQTYNTNILIWKQKNYYVFDPEPRNEELYRCEEGYAVVANLYDVPSIASMLLNRGKIENWPYIISKITIKNVQSEYSDGDTLREESLYKIVTPTKAVVMGSLSIADDCFGEFRNKQAFAIAVISLVYNNVTPACSWTHGTVDKILRVSNQFFIECLRGSGQPHLTIDNIPAFFTVGPLMVEISIGGSLFVGVMFRKAKCLFAELLEKFFKANTKAIVEIDCYVISIWRNRDLYYMFDPYSRDLEGHQVKNGQACVTMNTDLQTIIETVLHNFKDRYFIFKLHAMKMLRITRDPDFGRKTTRYSGFPETPEEKNITVDVTELAVHQTMPDDTPQPSIEEVGSLVDSLGSKYVPHLGTCTAEMLQKPMSPKVPQRVIDLDSPTLSETQLADEKKADSYEFKLIQEIFDEDQYDLDDEELDYLELVESDYSEKLRLVKRSIKEFNIKGDEDDLTPDFHECKKRPVSSKNEKKVGQANTDLLGLVVMPREVLEQNKPPLPPKTRIKIQKKLGDRTIPEITQSKELKKTSNFILLPDGSEILYGSKNISHFTYDYENASPFVSAVAIVMESKYTLTTWTQNVVDAILSYGYELFVSLEVNYAEVPTIVIPRLTIGQNSFRVSINFLFDSLLALDILEQCLQKLVFREWESAIIVTQKYSCAVFLKRKLYYMYDGFGNNLVGLGEGPDNSGIACMFRFKSLRPLVKRFLFNKRKREAAEPTEASRFLVSTVTIQNVENSALPTMISRREKQLPRIKGEVAQPYFESNPMNVEANAKTSETAGIRVATTNLIGYRKKGEFAVIEGSAPLKERNSGLGEIKPCHFIGICAMIGIFSKPIKLWDTRRIDYVMETGNKLFGYLDKYTFADKRNITNLLFDKHFYDVIVKRVSVADERKLRNFRVALEHLLLKNKYLLIQFPNCCFVLYRGKTILHLFDPYGLGTHPKACWIKFEDLKKMINYIFHSLENRQQFFFYTINISKFRKATRKQKLDYKLRASYVKKRTVPKKADICYEDEDWLLVYPIPWSRMKKELACGKTRGAKTHRWYDWDTEYPHDLYSLTSSINQTSTVFPRRYRGKQTIANCIVAIIMTEIYNFTDWNTNIMDAILKDGNQYFIDCFKTNTTQNYEIKVEDFLHTVLVFPYSFTIDLFPLIEGTMYIVKQDQFNISKALQYFFQVYENRCGVICCTNGTRTKYLAFGRVRAHEYFMYDCSSLGPPMFLDAQLSKAYILRCLTLNRLIHIITVTLRSGDFFIYHVAISEEQEEQLQQVTFYDKTGPSTEPETQIKFNEIEEKSYRDENENM